MKVKKLLCAILLTALLGSLCSCGSQAGSDIVDDFVDDLNRQSEFATGKTFDENMQDVIGAAQDALGIAEDEHITKVKGGTSSAYPGITYEEAFENFFSNPAWEYFVGTHEGPDDDGDGEPDYTVENVDVVEFTGGCLYADVEVTALIQFVLDEEAGTFQPTYLSFNDVPQSMLMLGGLMETVFTQAVEDGVGNGTAQSAGTSEPSQENHPSTETKSDTVLETDYYTITIPASWDGRYTYEQDGNNLTFYELSSYENGWGGELFGISLREDEEFLEFPGYYSMGALVELVDGTAPNFLYYVAVSTPTDVQFSDDAAETYTEMYESKDTILASLSTKAGYTIITG